MIRRRDTTYTGIPRWVAAIAAVGALVADDDHAFALQLLEQVEELGGKLRVVHHDDLGSRSISPTRVSTRRVRGAWLSCTNASNGT